MKKRIIGILIVVLITIVIIYCSANRALESSIEITTAIKKTFLMYYKCEGVVKGNEHYIFFEGNITELKLGTNETVSKGDVILAYRDYENKKVELKSTITGTITDEQNNYLIISDNEYCIECYIPYDKYSMINEKTECSYFINNDCFKGVIQKKFDIVENDKYKITIVPENKSLILNQKIIVKLPIENKEGIVVDKKAILKNDDGYFLLKEQFKNDFTHVSDYLVPIEIIMENDTEALISGVGIENLNICLLNESIKELLVND